VAVTLSPTRRTYLDTARILPGLLGLPECAEHWDSDSRLPLMSVGALTGHATRAVFQVAHYLDDPDPGDPRPVDAAGYLAAVPDLADPDSEVNAGVRRRGQDLATRGLRTLATDLTRCLDDLTDRLPTEPVTRQVRVFGGHPMLLDEYLRTRLVELVVHLDDLALSLGVPTPDLPDAALVEVVEVLVGVARRRHGPLAVVRALARRERDTVRALRVL
jgi:hypothetical protein